VIGIGITEYSNLSINVYECGGMCILFGVYQNSGMCDKFCNSAKVLQNLCKKSVCVKNDVLYFSLLCMCKSNAVYLDFVAIVGIRKSDPLYFTTWYRILHIVFYNFSLVAGVRKSDPLYFITFHQW